MHRVRLRRRSDALLALVDVAMAVLASWSAYHLRFENLLPLPSRYTADYFGTTIGLCVGFVVAARAAGLYRRAALRPGDSNVEPAFESAIVVGAALLLVDQFGLHGRLSRAWVGLVVLLLILFAIGSRSILRHSRRALVPFGIGLERYAVLGESPDALRLMRDLTRASGAPYQVVGTLPIDDLHEVVVRAHELRLDGLVLPPASESLAAELAHDLSGAGIDLLLAPRLGQLDLRVANIAMLHGVPLLRAAGLTPTRRAVRRNRGDLSRGVAIMGTRGIPANYGGFETFAERLALRLHAQGVPVTVYCRSHYATGGSSWRGITLVTLPTIRSKYFDTVVHTTLSTLHLIFRTRIQKVILCNAANAPVLPLLRVARRTVLMNVDGLEWRRGKWGIAGRSWYRMGEWLSVRMASVLVTDADEVRTYYRVRHDADSVMIPYGADLIPRGTQLPEAIDSGDIDLPSGGFALYVSRWETENNPLMVAEAHAAAGLDMPLVMLGQATYDHALGERVASAAAANAWLPGAIFGDGYRALQANARCYIHATEVGGTHPALIEAMGAGNLCLVLDTPENREVAGDPAWFFGTRDELATLLRKVQDLDESSLDSIREATRASAQERFSWETVANSYLELLAGPASRS